MSFNPFTKEIEDLNVDDLNLLVENHVAEGYCIEYKSEFPSGEKIAKSISSFANTLGGWYFIGIEADKIKNEAKRISGISLIDIPDPIAKLRDFIKSNIDPIPVFLIHLIDIGLNRVVLIVNIPSNQNTPFITKSGRIFRRNNDSSDPVFESDRYILDRLIENGKDLDKQFLDFCVDRRKFCKSEENSSWVNIYISPYPPDSTHKLELISAYEIERLLKISHESLPINIENQEYGSTSLPFTTGQFGIDSIILRQVDPTKLAYNSLQAELYVDGKAKFYIPLTYIPVLSNDKESSCHTPQVHKIIKEIYKNENDLSFLLLRFFDFQQLLQVAISLTCLYQYWRNDLNQDLNIRMIIEFKNIWRAVPFVDNCEWATHIIKYGLPVSSVNESRAPGNNMKGINVKEPLWIVVSYFICLGFGLPPEIFPKLIFTP